MNDANSANKRSSGVGGPIVKACAVEGPSELSQFSRKKGTRMTRLRPIRVFRVIPRPNCHRQRAAARYAKYAIPSKK